MTTWVKHRLSPISLCATLIANTGAHFQREVVQSKACALSQRLVDTSFAGPTLAGRFKT